MVKQKTPPQKAKTKPKAKGKPKALPKAVKPKKVTGRPPIHYDVGFHPEQAYKYALLGLTQLKMAELFGISEDTFYEWKKKYKEFSESIENGGDKADAEVANSLHKRALGYVKTVEQAFKVKKGKDMEVVEIVTLKQEEAPDTKAATLWLSNRQRNKWKDRQTQEHDVSDDLVARLQKGRDKHNAFMATLSVQIKSHNNEEE